MVLDPLNKVGEGTLLFSLACLFVGWHSAAILTEFLITLNKTLTKRISITASESGKNNGTSLLENWVGEYILGETNGNVSLRIFSILNTVFLD